MDSGRKANREREEFSLDKSKRAFDLVYLIISAAVVLVMLAGGFVQLPLFAAVLGAAASLVMLVVLIMKNRVSMLLAVAELTLVTGIFLYFLIWGADGFLRRLWWNAIWAVPNAALFVVLIRSDKIFTRLKARIAALVMLAAMLTVSVTYVFFMSLRARPRVEDMSEGHDAYLSSVKKADGDAPNVLVILMDDMAYADISSYSYLGSRNATINTPNIDSIADDGIMMDNFYASSPVCSPSRFSILTGRYSSRGYLDNVVFPTPVDSTPYSITHFVNPFQFYNNVDGILGDEITLAEVLQTAGYSTACIGKWNLGDYGEYLPTSQGFDYFYGSYYVNDMTPYDWVRDSVSEDGGFSHEQVRTHAENLDQSESTALFTEELSRFISESVDSGEKFFAYYTTPWPHYPIFSNASGEGKGYVGDDTYIDCIEEFDAYLGRVLDLLKSKNVYDDTLIVFTSDNGPGREGAAGALRGRKNTTFEGGMKVPLIVSYPNGNVGAAGEKSSFVYYPDGVETVGETVMINASCMNIDFFPTILEYCGVTALPSDRIIDGVSLKSLWSEDPYGIPHDKLFYLKRGKAQAVQMRVDNVDYKYFKHVQSENSAFFNQFYDNYLFNLDLDPIEAYDVSKRLPKVAEKLREELDAFNRSVRENRRGIL